MFKCVPLDFDFKKIVCHRTIAVVGESFISVQVLFLNNIHGHRGCHFLDRAGVLGYPRVKRYTPEAGALAQGLCPPPSAGAARRIAVELF